MHQLRTDRTLNLSVYVLSKTKKSKKNQKTYEINSEFYSTTVKNFIVSTKQSNKMSISNDIVSNNFRIEIKKF